MDSTIVALIHIEPWPPRVGLLAGFDQSDFAALYLGLGQLSNIKASGNLHEMIFTTASQTASTSISEQAHFNHTLHTRPKHSQCLTFEPDTGHRRANGVIALDNLIFR